MAKTVVVTGGSKGLGLGLCKAFLERGASVAFCGRGETAVRAVETELDKVAANRVLGVVANVASAGDLQRVWDETAAKFGRVDVWINNAGIAHVQKNFVQLETTELAAVVSANLMGTINGLKVALAGMKAQGGPGHVFTMEGFGSDGSLAPGMSVYGATKRAIRYLTAAVVKETATGPVRVGSLSPGIVVTEMLVDVYKRGDPQNWQSSGWLFEVIADHVDTVAPWLAAEVLAGPAHGAHVAWMTVPKAMLRMVNPHYHRRGLFAGKLPSGTRGLTGAGETPGAPDRFRAPPLIGMVPEPTSVWTEPIAVAFSPSAPKQRRP